MARAENIIKGFLDKAGIENTFDDKEQEVKFEVGGCKIGVHKHKYVKGYAISTKCVLEKGTHEFQQPKQLVESRAEFIDGFIVALEDDMFMLHGMSGDHALNAGTIDVVTKTNKKLDETGKWYIECEGYNGCTAKKS